VATSVPVPPLYHLGLGYKPLGLEGLAMSAFAEALRLDPSDADELQSLQR